MSGASVRLENAVTYSTGNEGQNDWGDFSEIAPLQRFSTFTHRTAILRWPFFTTWKNMHVYATPSNFHGKRDPTASRMTREDTLYVPRVCTSVLFNEFAMITART